MLITIATLLQLSTGSHDTEGVLGGEHPTISTQALLTLISSPCVIMKPYSISCVTGLCDIIGYLSTNQITVYILT